MARLLTVRLLVLLFALALASVQPAAACGVEGNVERSDGSKVDRTAQISSSWNSSSAVPKAGWFTLDLGAGACGQRITVYIDRNGGKEITLPRSGNGRVDFVLR